MAAHDPATRMGRWRRAWTVEAVRNDPGRRWLAQRLSNLRLPTEMAVEIGNAAWEQQELRRVAARHPGIPPRVVEHMAKWFSERRLFDLERMGFSNLARPWNDLVEAPIQGYVQLARPVVLDVPSGMPLPEYETFEPREQYFYSRALVLQTHFPDIYDKIQAWLDHLGYDLKSRPYYIALIAGDLRNIWVAGFFGRDFPIDDTIARPLPRSILGSEPPNDQWGTLSGAWLYRRFCIQYLKNHGGPVDERFYDDVYSIGLTFL